MTGPNASHDPEDEKPLDPAAERVRRKLVRFMGINLAILFIAVMAVVLAFVYKSMEPGGETAASQQSGQPSESVSSRISLPTGAQIVSHAVSGNRLTLYLRRNDGSEAIDLYDVEDGRHLGQIEIVREGQ